MSFQAAPAVSPSPATTTTTTEPDRSAAFQGKDASSESVPGGTLMIAAYIIVWVVVLALVVRVFQRQNSLAKQLAELEEDLQKRAPRGE